MAVTSSTTPPRPAVQPKAPTTTTTPPKPPANQVQPTPRTVRYVQAALKDVGFDPGKESGLGEKTRSALKQFQQARGITPSGEVTERTLKALKFVRDRVKEHRKDGDRFYGPGQKSGGIKISERRLAKLGYDVGKADGVFDRQTQKAVEAFKKDQKELKSNWGVLGERGLKSLRKESAALEHHAYRGRQVKNHKQQKRLDEATGERIAKGWVGRGAEGRAVANIQRHLRAAGFDPKRIDGKFDERTEGALKAFQKKVGLEPTGEVGGGTWKKLKASLMLRDSGTEGGQRLWEKSAAVLRTEKRLRALGYKKVKADGIFDRATQRASRAFEKKLNGLGDDGTIGKEQLTRMGQVLRAKRHPGRGPLAEKGDRGGPIKALQKRLEKLGFNPGGADGVFGQKTKSAVKKFQHAFGLDADGVVGKRTWRMLAIRPDGRLNGGGGVGGGFGNANLSARAKAQMRNLMNIAARNASGKSPQGWCLKAVQDYMQATTYGKAGGGVVPRFPYARNFAEFMNSNGNAARYGLKRLRINNPYKAPPGAIVVVRPGTPGTAHPTAGDISIKGPGATFYNDGMMGYGGSGNFYPGNNYVLGIYVPR